MLFVFFTMLVFASNHVDKVVGALPEIKTYLPYHQKDYNSLTAHTSISISSNEVLFN